MTMVIGAMAGPERGSMVPAGRKGKLYSCAICHFDTSIFKKDERFK